MFAYGFQSSIFVIVKKVNPFLYNWKSELKQYDLTIFSHINLGQQKGKNHLFIYVYFVWGCILLWYLV